MLSGRRDAIERAWRRTWAFAPGIPGQRPAFAFGQVAHNGRHVEKNVTGGRRHRQRCAGLDRGSFSD
jgi:hypothetical protein